MDPHDDYQDDEDEHDDATVPSMRSSALVGEYVRVLSQRALTALAALVLAPFVWGVCCAAWLERWPPNAGAAWWHAESVRALWQFGRYQLLWAVLLCGVAYAVFRVTRCVLRALGLWEHACVVVALLVLAPLPLCALEQTVFYVADSVERGAPLLEVLNGEAWNRSHTFRPELHPSAQALGYMLTVEQELQFISAYDVRDYGFDWAHYRMGVDLTVLYLGLTYLLYSLYNVVWRAHRSVRAAALLKAQTRARKIQ